MFYNLFVYGQCAIKIHFELKRILTRHINYILCCKSFKIMTEQEIKEELCYYDLRNPDVVGTYGMTKEELKEDGYGNHAKKDCSCDNCFYGITKMAEELLKYVSNGA